MRNHLSNLYIGRVLSAVLGDMSCLVLAAWLTWVVLNPPFPGHFFALAVALGCVASFVALYYVGSYRLTTLGSGRGTLECVLACMGMAFVAALLEEF